MMESVLRMSIVIFLVWPEVENSLAQRAPCYECEMYKDAHPQSNPYEEIRSHCTYPCECPVDPDCPPGVSVIRDGCGCCDICARQRGEECDGTLLCDERKGLVCQYPRHQANKGFCQVIKGLPCTVYNQTYDNGETFMLDCRTQCACQNGTYACASLCPQENISPTGACKHPRLVDIPGQCCREWMCDSTAAQHPPECQQQFTQWTKCSSSCGVGYSFRISNLNPQCRKTNESRLCQTRPCRTRLPQPGLEHARHHHVRKGHECKATQRVSSPVRLRYGHCRSWKRYRPKFCGNCGPCCEPQFSTTLKIDFLCPSGHAPAERGGSPGHDLWWEEEGRPWKRRRAASKRRRSVSRAISVKLDREDSPTTMTALSVQWIIKCRCSKTCPEMQKLDDDDDDEYDDDDDVLLPLGTVRPTNENGEVLLHRVHRTAGP